ncbi:MAG: PEP/pyruvate-binding domain-containing protein [Chlamydiota bacterium]
MFIRFLLVAILINYCCISLLSGDCYRLNHRDIIPQADKIQYGPKCARLISLQNSPHYKKDFDIPAFFPIANQEIKDYLNFWNPYWQSLWQKFYDIQSKESNNSIAPEAIPILQAIRELIKETFRLHPYSSLALESWLEQHESETLIVRSSGNEDSDYFINVGGNLSVPAIGVNKSEVSQAIGDVVASYFSPYSLKQRLWGGDDILSDTSFALFLQVMETELFDEQQASYDIPTITSGIMHTSKYGRSLDETTFIQSCFGNGKMIIEGNSEGFDTFYINSQSIVHSLIGEKRWSKVVSCSSNNRDFPGYELKTVPNHPKIRKLNSLKIRTAKRLKKIASELQQHFCKPMVIEWVYNADKDRIYVVEARPAMSPFAIHKTTYLSQELIDNTESVSGAIIAASGDYVRIISHKDDVIIAPDVLEALQIYRQHKRPTKAVIVKHWTPSTSNAVTILRAAGIAVFTPDDFEKVHSWLQQDDQTNAIYLDVQRSLCVKALPSAEENIDNENSFFRQGVIALALQKNRSIIPASHPPATLEQLLGETSPESTETFAELYSTLLTASDSKKAAILKKIYHRGCRIYYLSQNNPELRQRSASLLKALEYSCQEMVDALQGHAYQGLALHWLWCILFQQNNPCFACIDSFCLIEAELGAVPHTDDVTKYKKLSKRALNDHLASKWESFIDSAQYYPQHQQEKLFSSLDVLKRHKISAEWLNTSFSQLVKDETLTTLDIINAIYKDNIFNIPHIADLDKKQEILTSWKNDTVLSNWEDPHKFESLWELFQLEFIPLTQERKIYQYIEDSSASPLVLLAYLKYLEDLANTYDLTIKKVKGSPHYASKNEKSLQCKRVAMMLKGLKDMMNATLEMLPAEYFLCWSRHVFEDRHILQKEPLLKFISQAFSFHAAHNDPSELHPSTGFSPLGAAIGSGCAFFRALTGHTQITKEEAIKAITLEDLFELFHTNILRALAVEYYHYGLNRDVLPPLMAFVCERIEDITCDIYTPGNPHEMQFYSTSSPYLFSLQYPYPEVKAVYIHPLRDHSATFQVSYNQKTSELLLSGNFFGHNGNNRMTHIKHFLTLISIINGLELETAPTYDEQSFTLSYCWKFLDDHNDEDLKAFFPSLLHYIARLEKSMFFCDLSPDLDTLFLQAYQTITQLSDPEDANRILNYLLKQKLLTEDTRFANLFLEALKLTELTPSQQGTFQELLCDDSLPKELENLHLSFADDKAPN